jgi:hypothetical protein
MAQLRDMAWTSHSCSLIVRWKGAPYEIEDSETDVRAIETTRIWKQVGDTKTLIPGAGVLGSL